VSIYRGDAQTRATSDLTDRNFQTFAREGFTGHVDDEAVILDRVDATASHFVAHASCFS